MNNKNRYNIISQMYFASRRRKEDHQILEDNVNYPEASVREYLNIRRTTKNKCCLVTFCTAMIVIIMLTGIGFFYGNSSNIGLFINKSGDPVGNSTCTYLNPAFDCSTTCTSPGSQLYLQKICLPANQPSGIFSSSLLSQIQIYNFKQAFDTMLYTNVGILVGMILCFLVLICYPKLIYFYIFLGFLVLLGFSFYLLKSIETRVQYWKGQSVLSGIIIDDQNQMASLAYILLALYLVIFPMIIFAPKKIRVAVQIISSLEKYFSAMFTIIAFTILIAITSYGLIFLLGFLLMNFFTDGNPVKDANSFFYLYEKVSLSNPAVLALYFFGICWLFGALFSWHKYLIGSSVLQWYFQDGGKLKPVRKGLRRAWYQLGSAAIDSLLTPLEWIILLLYSITKIESDNADDQAESAEDCLCCSNFIYSFRKFITKAYCKINRGTVSSGALTNQPYTQGCEISAVIFSENKHKFFNIGGNLTLYLSLFSMLVFVFINYLALYNNIYLSSNPSPISSLTLPVILSVSLGVTVGQLMSNLFTASVDCLLFCFLLEKKNGVEYSTNQIKKHLEDLYNKQEEVEEVKEMYELQPDE